MPAMEKGTVDKIWRECVDFPKNFTPYEDNLKCLQETMKAGDDWHKEEEKRCKQALIELEERVKAAVLEH